MSAGEREPTREEILAMAYADGELAEGERREFEAVLATRSDLALEVVRFRRLEVLARRAAGPEPMDMEWRRLEAEPLHRAGRRLGWLLLGSGLAVLLGWCVWTLIAGDIGLVPKLGLGALLAGAALLFTLAVRARLRTRVYDPYAEIRR
ncbi:MAG TPA: hypothetical protein VMS76_02280 [Planctomycetota bacterium]|nr:hypothetical protein [Planctomycetota bacterium]